MKKAFLFLLIIAAGIVACNKTDDGVGSGACQEVNCLNGGACNDGNCICLSGFAGEFCQTVVNGPCDTLACENGGNCITGWCDCTECYEGSFCETESREQFVANYNGFLDASSWGIVDQVYNINVVKNNGNVCRLSISDNLGNEYICLAQSNSNSMDIPQQSFTFQGDQGTVVGNFYLDNTQQLFGSLNFNLSSGGTIYFTYEGLVE